MTTSSNMIVGQLNSIRTSLMNTIIDLRMLEDEAREEGKTAEANQLRLQWLELNSKSIVLGKASAAAGANGSLAPHINALKQIARDARRASKRLKTINEALVNAAKILTLLGKLGDLIG